MSTDNTPPEIPAVGDDVVSDPAPHNREMAITLVDVDVPLTDAQKRAFDSKAKTLQDISTAHRVNTIRARYRVGMELVEVFDDQDGVRSEAEAKASKFGGSAVQRMSAALEVSLTDLYRFQEVATKFTPEQIEEIVAAGLSWSHVREAVRIPDSAKRMKMLMEIPKLPPGEKTVVEFVKRVQALEERKPEVNPATGEVEKTNTGTGKGGGGDRTGTGHGASPVTAVKASFKNCEKLVDNLGAAMAALGDFDPDSDKMREVMATNLDQALGVLVEAMSYGIGFIQAGEEYLDHNPIKNGDKNQQARKNGLIQVKEEIEKFLAPKIDARDAEVAKEFDQEAMATAKEAREARVHPGSDEAKAEQERAKREKMLVEAARRVTARTRKDAQ